LLRKPADSRSWDKRRNIPEERSFNKSAILRLKVRPQPHQKKRGERQKTYKRKKGHEREKTGLSQEEFEISRTKPI